MKQNTRKDYIISITLISSLFFIFGFATWLNGALIPFLKTACQLNDYLSYFITFAFYISYFVMAIPSSKILEKTGFKKGMSLGLLTMAIGAFIFIPAAYYRSYIMFLIGLFVLGSGLALLQTAVNPYVTIIGPIESAAKRISIMGICNKFAGILAPIILATIVLHDAETINNKLDIASTIFEKENILNELALRLITPYMLMGGIFLLLGILIKFAPLPEININNKEDETTKHKNIFHYPQLTYGVIALFFYVGVEVIAGDTIIRYGQSIGVSIESAKYFTSITLFAMVIGYFLGVALIPKIISQKTSLIICSLLGILFTTLALIAPPTTTIDIPFLDILTFKSINLVIPTTVFYISLLGLANSLVWPAIWPLALDGIGKYIKMGSALLIMAIAGGALLPLIYGKLAEAIGTQQAYIIAIPCYLIILFYALISTKLKQLSEKN